MHPSGPVVLAPDKFKGSMSALEVASHLRLGIHRHTPSTRVHLAPVADGGEGTVEAALVAGFTAVTVPTTGPSGAPVDAVIAVRGTTAVVELAQASGLQLLPDGPRPLHATSHGTGLLVRAALDAGCTSVVLGVGGSASTDGGAGLVTALGARLIGPGGADLAPGGAALADLCVLDLTGLDRRLAGTTFVLASDVDNPLLGQHGAAAVFAPQKGAGTAEVAQLERGLQRWAEVVTDTVGRSFVDAPGAGAAGGVGFGALALLGSAAQPGIDLMLAMIGFDELLADARLVVTGEGSLDEQTLHGKAPVGVARAADAYGVPTVAVAGRTTLGPSALRSAGFSATHTLQELEPDLHRCMTDPGPLLVRLGGRIARDWLGPSTAATSRPA